jgi:tRNA(Ile)-lysidine synthetase-like protein
LHTLKPSIYFTEKQLEMMHKRLSKDESSVRFKITGSTYLIRQYQMLGVYDTSAFKDCLIELNQVGTYPLDADRHIIVSLEKIRRPHMNQLELCYNKITFPITIRNPIEGDIMRFPYGHKRVSKILSDYKIPSPLRHSSLLVETKEGVQGILTLGVHNQSPCTSQKIYIYEVMNVA